MENVSLNVVNHLKDNNVHMIPTPMKEIVSLSGPIEKMNMKIDTKKKIILVKIS